MIGAGDTAAVARGGSSDLNGLKAQDRCDLAIVGGGIVGLAVARELSRRSPGASVCVLERESGGVRMPGGASPDAFQRERSSERITGTAAMTYSEAALPSL